MEGIITFLLSRFYKIRVRIKRLSNLVLIISSLNMKFLVNLIENIYEDLQIEIVRHVSPKKEIIHGIKSDIVFEAMYKGSFREPHFELLARALLTSGDNCLDLGANHGSHTLLLSEICYEGRVYSFEPQPRVFQALTLNVFLNQRSSNVTLFNLAVSDSTGKYINIEQVITTKNNHINSGWSRVSNSYSIQRCLTVALNDLEFDRIAFVKMDIQGSELLAVNGMGNILRIDRPYLFFEAEDVHLNFLGTSSSQLFLQILNANYIIFRIKNEYPHDCIAVPRERNDQFHKIVDNLDLNLEEIKEK